jgi:hypothetical protein
MTCAPFTATGDQIVDSSTGLKWTRNLLSSQTFARATTACTTWGGRLPTEMELTSFVQAIKPCETTITFPIPDPGNAVWSSTQDPSNSTFYFCVFFDGTPPLSAPDTDGHYTLCVK